MKKFFIILIMVLMPLAQAQVSPNQKCYGIGDRSMGTYDLITDAVVFEEYMLIGGKIYQNYSLRDTYEDLVSFANITNPLASIAALFESYENQKEYMFCFEIDPINQKFTGKLVRKN